MKRYIRAKGESIITSQVSFFLEFKGPKSGFGNKRKAGLPKMCVVSDSQRSKSQESDGVPSSTDGKASSFPDSSALDDGKILVTSYDDIRSVLPYKQSNDSAMILISDEAIRAQTGTDHEPKEDNPNKTRCPRVPLDENEEANRQENIKTSRKAVPLDSQAKYSRSTLPEPTSELCAVRQQARHPPTSFSMSRRLARSLSGDRLHSPALVN
ncbi:hypothetical protein O181_000595 [Austropuccinia psidii MF-1]|uniref:Uncharacterized protein n=1 Tax=Austropuccinia psidii MF-1 TaxID=1389203 RepID=A0A9Q3B960_9BASI|nr:hypothetical protein [Austropuccinia psidii MF-1]